MLWRGPKHDARNAGLPAHTGRRCHAGACEEGRGGGAAPAGNRAAGRVRALGRCVQALVFFSFLAFLMGGPGRRVPTLAMPNQPRQQVRGSTQHTLGVCAWHLPSTHPRPPSRTGVGQEKIERECF